MAQTELWFVNLEGAADALEALQAEAPRLSVPDNLRLAAMANADARRERRLAHIALRILLEARCGPSVRQVPFVVTPSGKPMLGSGLANFSLAHTRGRALVAIADREPIGVDLEHARSVTMPPARRAPIEQAAIALAGGTPLNEQDPDSRFLSAWVRIEAAAKAWGTGVSPILERLRPGGDPVAALTALAETLPPLSTYELAIEDGAYAAIALPRGEKPPQWRTVPETLPALSQLLGA